MTVKRMDNVSIVVEELDDTLARLTTRGAEIVDQVVDYQSMYRLCYVRGPEGILIGLAQQREASAFRANPMRERGNGGDSAG